MVGLQYSWSPPRTCPVHPGPSPWSASPHLPGHLGSVSWCSWVGLIQAHNQHTPISSQIPGQHNTDRHRDMGYHFRRLWEIVVFNIWFVSVCAKISKWWFNGSRLHNFTQTLSQSHNECLFHKLYGDTITEKMMASIYQNHLWKKNLHKSSTNTNSLLDSYYLCCLSYFVNNRLTWSQRGCHSVEYRCNGNAQSQYASLSAGSSWVCWWFELRPGLQYSICPAGEYQTPSWCQGAPHHLTEGK